MADQKTQNFLRKMKDRLLGGMVDLGRNVDVWVMMHDMYQIPNE